VHMEPILTLQTPRSVVYRVDYPDLWRIYKTATAGFWTAADIDKLEVDVGQWQGALNTDERTVLSTILALSATAARNVFGDLRLRPCAEVLIVEARVFYRFQVVMANIHSETYSMLLLALVGQDGDRDGVRSNVETMPTVRAKAEWCSQWLANEGESTFGTRLVAVAVMEAIFLSSSFAVMFWMRSRGLMPALTKSYELIARDAGLRTSFAFLLYRHLHVRPSSYVVRRMVEDAVWLEVNFVEAVIPHALKGMDSSLARDYVQYVGDYVLENFGLGRWFRVENPVSGVLASVLLSSADAQRGSWSSACRPRASR
ncbi:ribonucleotide reductase, partial [Lentinus brumalis]